MTARQMLQVLAEFTDLSPELLLFIRREHHAALLPGKGDALAKGQQVDADVAGMAVGKVDDVSCTAAALIIGGHKLLPI